MSHLKGEMTFLFLLFPKWNIFVFFFNSFFVLKSVIGHNWATCSPKTSARAGLSHAARLLGGGQGGGLCSYFDLCSESMHVAVASIHTWADALCVKYLVSFFPHGSVCGQFHFLFFWQKCPSSFFTSLYFSSYLILVISLHEFTDTCESWCRWLLNWPITIVAGYTHPDKFENGIFV